MNPGIFFKLLYYIHHFYSIDSNKSSKRLVVVFKILITIKAYRKRSKFNAGDFVVVCRFSDSSLILIRISLLLLFCCSCLANYRFLIKNLMNYLS